MAEIIVPPLVGSYGPSGVGKSVDKIWAFPHNSLIFATPGSLTAAKNLIGYLPPPENVVQLDTLTADFAFLRDESTRRLEKARGKYKAVIVDDFSMAAHRTARLFGKMKEYKDGRRLYGAIRGFADELFDLWRSFGLAVLVDCHEDPQEWEVDENGKRIGVKHIGLPDLPGRQAGPDMIKAFDIFYRVHHDPMRTDWPYCYVAGPKSPQAMEWATKDRWTVYHPKTGMVPMNIAEVLRAIGFATPRPHAVEEVVEPLVAFATDEILSGRAMESSYLPEVAKAMVKKGHPVSLIRWFARDTRARVEIKRAMSDQTQLDALGLAGFSF